MSKYRFISIKGFDGLLRIPKSASITFDRASISDYQYSRLIRAGIKQASSEYGICDNTPIYRDVDGFTVVCCSTRLM